MRVCLCMCVKKDMLCTYICAWKWIWWISWNFRVIDSSARVVWRGIKLEFVASVHMMSVTYNTDYEMEYEEKLDCNHSVLHTYFNPVENKLYISWRTNLSLMLMQSLQKLRRAGIWCRHAKYLVEKQHVMGMSRHYADVDVHMDMETAHVSCIWWWTK